MEETRTKVVVRKLPPTLSEDAFKEAAGNGFTARWTWSSYFPGKIGTKGIKYSRAYLHFKKLDEVVAFCQHFQDHLFVNERGVQFRAQVEFAPFQSIPKVRRRKDPRTGTIEKDAEYLAFLEELERPEEMLPSAEVQLERKEQEEKDREGSTGEKPVIITPLMQFIIQKSKEKSRTRSVLQRPASGRALAVAARPPSSTGSAASAGGRKQRDQPKDNHSPTPRRPSRDAEGESRRDKGRGKDGKEGSATSRGAKEPATGSADSGGESRREARAGRQG
eukprot:CAMPEP_0196578698 /NCGR_PEP_ID=MMETSP1081-20130531/7557_1 /TAXON_ID=36882 /ORGANISM="Pyramimonas amylifera, Strain CCMP720" /LENGTH=276 /DNA_ID=CAMNT_0041897993 /DNA_START=75 /DNA_END=902 /DNA_ORIENTATION=-